MPSLPIFRNSATIFSDTNQEFISAYGSRILLFHARLIISTAVSFFLASSSVKRSWSGLFLSRFFLDCSLLATTIFTITSFLSMHGKVADKGTPPSNTARTSSLPPGTQTYLTWPKTRLNPSMRKPVFSTVVSSTM